MKNDYEMYQSLLSRYDEYQEKKKKRSVKIKRTVPVIASFCFVVSLGFAYQKYYSKIPIIPQQPYIITETTETTNTQYTTSNISTTHIATTATHTTTTVTVETKTKQTSLTTTMQTEIIENTTYVGENIVQTEPPTNVTQAPTASVTITETQPNIELTTTTISTIMTTTISTIMTTTITPVTQPTESTTTIDNGENGGGGEGGGLQCVDMPFNEKYFLADLQTGESYYSAFMRIPADMIETDIDMATMRGFDSFYNEWFECTIMAYSISEYSEDEVIAVRADDTYYVYYNRLLNKERKNQILEELKKSE